MHKQYIPLNLLISIEYKLEDPRGELILLELIIEGCSFLVTGSWTFKWGGL